MFFQPYQRFERGTFVCFFNPTRGGVYICWEFHFPPRLQTFVETPVLVLIEISSFQAVFSIVNGYFEIGSVQVVFSIVNGYFEIRFFGLFDGIFCIGF